MAVITTGAVGRARSVAPRLNQVITALLWATAAVNVAFFAGLIIDGNSPIVGVWLSLAVQWVPVTVFWLVAVRAVAQRAAIVLAALAVTFSAIGDTYYALAMDADGELVFPSPADAAYLVFYPLLVAALVMLVRSQLRGVGRLVLVETAVATMGAAAVLAVVLGPVIGEALAGDDAFSSTIALAYPLFDVLLLAAMTGIASVPMIRLGGRWGALIAGLLIFAIADIVYALLEVRGTYIAGTPLDATWAVGLALMTWWVAGILPANARRPPGVRRGSIVTLPAVAVLAGLTVLIIGTGTPLPVLPIVLAAVTVGLAAVPIVFRQAMLGRMLAAQEKVVERLTELDNEKTAILATVNHEFRTPLTSINGHTELLLDGGAGELPSAALDMLQTIERNGARLQTLIDETFAASRFDGEYDTQTRDRVAIAEVVAAAVAKVEPRAAKAMLEFSAPSVDAALDVMGDRAQLERVLVDLLDNAVKFTPAGGHVKLSVETVRAEVVIRVRDNGIGIPPEDVDRLFTRFFRASNVQSAAIAGVGLGLSIAQKIVIAHGGTIGVESVVGRGTTMTLRLPAASAPIVRRVARATVR